MSSQIESYYRGNLLRLPYITNGFSLYINYLEVFISAQLMDSVRVAMVVCCAAQHATLHSTAQHPCALQLNATQVQYIPSIVLATLGA